MNKISPVRSKAGKIIPNKLNIDGTEVLCRAFRYENRYGEIPVLTLEVSCLADIDGEALTQIHFTPESVHDAISMLRHELKINGNLYEWLADRIRYALEEGSCDISDSEDLVNAIIDSIMEN